MSIKKGKLSRGEQSARRQMIIEYIRTHGPVKSSRICEDLSLSRSSLSDDISAVNAQQQIILSPKRGWYEIDPALGNVSVRDTMDRQYVRRWFVLSALSAEPLSFAKLKKTLEDLQVSCSESTLHSDLQELKKAGLVNAMLQNGEILYLSSSIFAAGSGEIRRYRSSQKSRAVGSRMIISAYAGIDKKLRHAGAGDLILKPSPSTRSTGKQNTISREQLDALERFEQFPFQSNALKLTYQTNAGNLISTVFFTALIVYSVETNRIYLLGKDDRQLNTVIPLDQVVFSSVEVLQEGAFNQLYESKEFLRICQEMLNVSTDAPYDVRIRFQDLPFIREKVERLHAIRPSSKILSLSDDAFLYTDRVRGLNDLARYLRRFGRSAIVEAPEELREKLITTSEKVIALYSEGAEDE